MIYKIAILSDKNFQKTKVIGELLGIYFPYNIIANSNSPLANHIKELADGMRCNSSFVHQSDVKLIYSAIVDLKPDMFIIFWNRKDKDTKYYIEQTYEDGIPSVIYYYE